MLLDQTRKMSQEQPRTDQDSFKSQDEPIRYGDVFPVTGDLAEQPVTPRDAAMMQSAESTVFGQTLKGGAAAIMESAAAINERRRAIGHSQFSELAGDQGVTVAQTDIPGQPHRCLVTEFVAGQAVRQYVVDVGGEDGGDEQSGGGGGEGAAVAAALWSDKITIGEALEATVKTAGDKPVEPSDAAAIQAAEATATGVDVVLPGGVAAAAQAAVMANAWVDREEGKTKLGDVLADATAWMPADKEATRHDAERVVGAEVRNSPNLDARPGGVAAAVTAAAQLNEPSR